MLINASLGGKNVQFPIITVEALGDKNTLYERLHIKRRRKRSCHYLQ